jgi:hypothetical protein
MNYFIILGTSKSQNHKAYYIQERFKMWAMLFVGGIIPYYWENAQEHLANGTTEFTQRFNFEFHDLITEIEANDSDIKWDSHRQEIEKKISSIENNSKITHILFNGKSAASIYNLVLSNEPKKESLSGFKKHRKLLEYGLMNLKSNKICYCLPNTSGRGTSFDEFPWLHAFKQIKSAH